MGERRLCRLQHEVGHDETCQEDRCAFWEPGGDGRCSLEHVDLTAGAELAPWLLGLRRRLDEVREFPDPARGISVERFRAQSDAGPAGRGKTRNRNRVDDRPST